MRFEVWEQLNERGVKWHLVRRDSYYEQFRGRVEDRQALGFIPSQLSQFRAGSWQEARAEFQAFLSKGHTELEMWRGRVLPQELAKRILAASPVDSVYWACKLLELARLKYDDELLAELSQVGATRKHWRSARELHNRIRKSWLDQQEGLRGAVYAVADRVAKIIYNGSGEGAPYDKPSTVYLTGDLSWMAREINEQEFTLAVWEAIRGSAKG